ncbi:MAG: flagellar biosynthetic protein FliO [Nitrospiraceae bacterium]|nr:flagellar biosynthetic protein FliO [Nitrospiraceae bacterium]
MILDYLRMFAALGAVVGLIYLAAAFMRKRQGGKPGILSVMAYQSFGPKKGIALLKLGADVLLVGVTPNELKLMKVYSGHELGLEEATGRPEGAGPWRGKDGMAR